MREGWQVLGERHWPITHNEGGMSVAERVEDRMLTLLKRHQVQTLLAAGHDQMEVARLAGVSIRSVRRVAAEPAVEHVDDGQERIQRRIGRPSKVEPFRALVQECWRPQSGRRECRDLVGGESRTEGVNPGL